MFVHILETLAAFSSPLALALSVTINNNKGYVIFSIPHTGIEVIKKFRREQKRRAHKKRHK
jgi:hypothetical protein